MQRSQGWPHERPLATVFDAQQSSVVLGHGDNPASGLTDEDLEERIIQRVTRPKESWSQIGASFLLFKVALKSWE